MTLSRRQLVAKSTALIAATTLPVAAVAAPAHPAAKFMQTVAAELLRAQRAGTISAFRSVLQRRADVTSIAMYSLGRYRADLPRSKRGAYYRGVREFMSRYFADQTRKYKVVNATVHDNVRADSSGFFLVDTSVKLASGSTYTVTWRVSKQRGRYKVNDVKVLGFSLSFLQRGIFYKFLKRKNGDVNALVAALNR